MSAPYTISFRGEEVVLSDDEADAISKSLMQQQIARNRVEQDAARKRGEVWVASYWRNQVRKEEECFSLREAASYLDFGDEEGLHSSEAIRYPDGTVVSRDDLNYDMWMSLVVDEVSA